ncbi:hypothetical protein [Pseudomonas phage PA1C]|uniref:Uncharacterized protein n=2 Tax=root TaxID=1 RepID=A0A5C1K824_9CAUD|nr:hypothetical protein PP933_gp200 [Pseudomonas phage vB_PaeM_PS119XW]QBX32355.1 hypothetical protein [Pseudomonas phage PA1C]QEM41929.1 hypothetical protein [Pseudomonas phage vB_PaeM_PS119XW]
MTYRSIEVLRSHFAVDHLTDLLYIDSVREQIEHFRFYYRGTERHICKEKGEYWCLHRGRNGEWVKEQLTETILSEFKVLDHEWRILAGIELDDTTEVKEEQKEYYDYLKQNEKKVEEESASELMAALFMGTMFTVTSCHIYRMWNK